MTNKTERFELKPAPAFKNIFGIFDNDNNRYVTKEDGHGAPYRFSVVENGQAVVNRLNAAHEVEQKAKRDAEFEAAKPRPRRTRAKVVKEVPAAPAPAHEVEIPAPKTRAKRSPAKAPVEAPKAAATGRRKKAA